MTNLKLKLLLTILIQLLNVLSLKKKKALDVDTSSEDKYRIEHFPKAKTDSQINLEAAKTSSAFSFPYSASNHSTCAEQLQNR